MKGARRLGRGTDMCPCPGAAPKNPYVHQRAGQALMNELYKLDKVFYHQITGTEIDCFYISDRMPATLAAWKAHIQARAREELVKTG